MSRVRDIVALFEILAVENSCSRIEFENLSLHLLEVNTMDVSLLESYQDIPMTVGFLHTTSEGNRR